MSRFGNGTMKYAKMADTDEVEVCDGNTTQKVGWHVEPGVKNGGIEEVGRDHIKNQNG